MIERTFRCDGPDCLRHVVTQSDRPPTFLVLGQDPGPDLHFCVWDCVLRYAGAIEPEEIIDA